MCNKQSQPEHIARVVHSPLHWARAKIGSEKESLFQVATVHMGKQKEEIHTGRVRCIAARVHEPD